MDKASDKINELETAGIPKLILKYSSVTFIALLFDALYNIIDTLFVGRGVGDNAMGGVAVALPFMLIQGAISQTVGSGAASLVSRYLGKKEYEKAGCTTANAMAVFYTAAVIVTIIGLIFKTPLLKICGSTDDILPFAEEYFTVIVLGNVFSTGFSSIIRAEGRMVYGLLIWLIPTGVNIALDAVFIYGLHMGVRGAALATVICQITSFAMSVIFFTRLSCQKFNKIKLDIKTVSQIITTGLPALLQMGSISLLFTVINKILAVTGGTITVNTFAYLGKIITFGIVPFNAVSQAVAPVIGFSFGAKSSKRTEKAYQFALLICLAYSAAAMALSLLFPQLFMKLFTDNSDIIIQGTEALKIIAASLPFVPITLITGSYLQAIGRKTPALAASGSLLVYMILLMIALSKPLGTQGIWIAILISCILSAITALTLKYIPFNKEKYSR